MPLSIKLFVSNLHFNVSDRDLMELFSEFGCITEATVHYNRWGYSLGSGHVIFKNKEDATEAINCYHGIYLDGRPLSITCIAHPSTSKKLPQKLPAKMRLSCASRKKPLKRLSKGPHMIIFPKNSGKKASKVKADKAKNVCQVNKRKSKAGINLTALDLDKELEEYYKARNVKTESRAVEPVKENSLSDLSDESFKDILCNADSTASDGELVAQVELRLDENSNQVPTFSEVPSGAKKGSHSEKSENVVIFTKVRECKEEPEVGVNALKESKCDLKMCSENFIDIREDVGGLTRNPQTNSVTEQNSGEEPDDLNLVLDGADEIDADDIELCYDSKLSRGMCSATSIHEEGVGNAGKVNEEIPEYYGDGVNEDESVLEEYRNISYELFDIKETDEESFKEVDPENNIVKEEGDTPDNNRGSVVSENASTKKVSRNTSKMMDESNSLEFSVEEILLETPENACHTFRIKKKIELENDNASSSLGIKCENDAGDSKEPEEMPNEAEELLMKPPGMKRKIKTRTNVRNAPKKKGYFS